MYERRGAEMKYINTLLWGFILGQVAFYIGSALEGNSYNFVQGSLMGLVLAIVVSVLAALLPSKKDKGHHA